MKLKKTKLMDDMALVIINARRQEEENTESGGKKGETTRVPDVVDLSQCMLRCGEVEWRWLKLAYNAAPKEWTRVHRVADVCRGSGVVVQCDARAASTKSEALVKHLDMLQLKLEEEAYNDMVKDVRKMEMLVLEKAAGPGDV